MDKFEGFPAAGFEWFRKLAKNNNRTWFEKHKQEYVDNLQAPALAMVVELGERLKSVVPSISYDARPNGGSMMRIYRDIRFSKDKTPYKTHIGINWWEGSGKGGTGFHFFMDAEGGVCTPGTTTSTSRSWLPTGTQSPMIAPAARCKRRSTSS